jgi:hypothetical protein
VVYSFSGRAAKHIGVNPMSLSWPRFVRHVLAVALIALAQCPVGEAAYRLSSTISAASGTTWHVPGDFQDIQAAIDAVAAGDTILVASGTYPASLNFNGKAVTVKSVQGPATTTIAGTGGTAITIGPEGMITGFTISNGAASFGGGMVVIGSGTVVRGNIFTNNAQGSGGYGAGIAGNGASPLIEGNIFRNNSCDNQFLSGVVSFVNASSPRIVNNIFEKNPCRAVNITVPLENTPVVMNNTIVANDDGIRIDARNSTAAQRYRNNILVGNIVGLQVDFGSNATNPTWQNNLVFGNTTNYEGIPDQTGLQQNIASDPLFIDVSSSRYELQTTSPAIDAGTNTECPATDFSGIARPQGLLCDMGAHEVIQTQISFANDSYRVNEGIGTATITVTLDQVLPLTATVDYTTANSGLPFAATAGQDYLTSTGTLIFTPGVTEQHFTISISDDKLVEQDENLRLVLSHGVAANIIIHLNAPVALTIVDNDHRMYVPLIVIGNA